GITRAPRGRTARGGAPGRVRVSSADEEVAPRLRKGMLVTPERTAEAELMDGRAEGVKARIAEAEGIVVPVEAETIAIALEPEGVVRQLRRRKHLVLAN